MTREEKIKKRKTRAYERRGKRMEKYIAKIKRAEMNHTRLNGCLREGPWKDVTSPTGWSQICDYVGTCQFPCNGDC